MTDEEMAEKYAKSNMHYEVAKREDGTDYAKEVSNVTIKQAFLAGLKSGKECSKDKWQNGAEFGYNKANEWYYVKDGDLPIEDLRQRTRGYYLTASKYKWHKWFIFDVAYFTGVIFTKGGAILDSVVAWKEIVPPNENKKETDLNPDYFSGGW